MKGGCLVIGASGQLGRAVTAVLRQRYRVIEAGRRPEPHRVHMDLEYPSEAAETVRSLAPEWVVMAGAYCNVDQAETDPERCFRVNTESPQAIAQVARALGSAVIYYSTDYVFDGSRESYEEADAVHPLNVYARSKAQGEAAIREALPDRHLILRTAWLYGPDEARRNFVLRLVDQLGTGGSAKVPADQWGTPTYTEDLAGVTAFLIARGQWGTFHAVGPELVDRVTLARAACRHFGIPEDGLLPMPTAALQQVARRPLRVRLNGRKLFDLGAQALRGPEDGFAALRRWHEGRLPRETKLQQACGAHCSETRRP